MSRVKIFSLVLMVVCLMAVGIVKVLAKSPTGKSSFVIRKVKEQVVLYTIHRGSYDKVGPVIGRLYGLAGKKGIIPRGSAYHVYLNNPRRVSSEHWLTEIRIPVGKEALKFAGSLGEMTDIKNLPAVDMAVAVKPEGQADPGQIYSNLYRWILQEGYVVVDSAYEMFLTNAMSGNYEKMKTEIMIPVYKALPAEPRAVGTSP